MEQLVHYYIKRLFGSPPPLPSAMTKFPVELIKEIFTMAAQEHQNSALALAATSKICREWTINLACNRVILLNSCALASFAAFVQSEPRAASKTRHLWISTKETFYRNFFIPELDHGAAIKHFNTVIAACTGLQSLAINEELFAYPLPDPVARHLIDYTVMEQWRNPFKYRQFASVKRVFLHFRPRFHGTREMVGDELAGLPLLNSVKEYVFQDTTDELRVHTARCAHQSQSLDMYTLAVTSNVERCSLLFDQPHRTTLELLPLDGQRRRDVIFDEWLERTMDRNLWH